MAKKDYYFKFLIKSNRKLKAFEVKEIKRLIWNYLGDVSILNIQGGEANNNGYHKFRVENDFNVKNGKC